MLVAHATRITNLEEVACLKKRKKRKAIPNPNKRFIALSKLLAAGESVPTVESQTELPTVNSNEEEAVVSDAEVAEVVKVDTVFEPPMVATRSGRLIKRSRKM